VVGRCFVKTCQHPGEGTCTRRVGIDQHLALGIADQYVQTVVTRQGIVNLPIQPGPVDGIGLALHQQEILGQLQLALDIGVVLPGKVHVQGVDQQQAGN